MGAAYVRKYNAAATLDGVCLRSAGTATIRANPTLAAGDVKIAKDGGAFANLATLPSAVPSEGKNIEVALSAAELSCARAVIIFSDVAGAEWDDFEIVIETFGNASAQFPPDYANSSSLGMTNLDATVSSRMATFTYTAPPSAASIAAQITIDHGSGSYVGGAAITIDNDAIEITG